MRSFLVKDGGKPIVRWTRVPNEIYFQGTIPTGYRLAVNPSKGYVILDIDVKNDKDGWQHIPYKIMALLSNHASYKTKSGGTHIWFKYTGNQDLLNIATKEGLDLRTHVGYVHWYIKESPQDFIKKVKPTCSVLNNWLEKWFSHSK